KNSRIIPYPRVSWPASDALVTTVGGTYLCMNAVTGAGVDSVSPPVNCQSAPGNREPGWVASGGGYSIYFDRPDYQNVLPPGSTYTGTSAGAPGKNANMRGIPDIAYQASARTGVLVYLTEPDTKGGTAGCGGANPCSTGWYTVGGTSASAPQWAGLIAIADQMAGHDLHPCLSGRGTARGVLLRAAGIGEDQCRSGADGERQAEVVARIVRQDAHVEASRLEAADVDDAARPRARRLGRARAHRVAQPVFGSDD